MKTQKPRFGRQLLLFFAYSFCLLTACEEPWTGVTSGLDQPIHAADSGAAAKASFMLPLNWVALQTGNGVIFGTCAYTRVGIPCTDYIQVIDLASGAKIRFRQGNANIASPTNPSPFFPKKLLASALLPSWYWPTYAKSNTFSMTNLQFFDTNTGMLSYPVKDNGTVISCGFANHENLLKRKLSIQGAAMSVSSYTNTSNLYGDVLNQLNNAPTVIVGLHPAADIDQTQIRGRVMVGYKNSTLYIYATSGATLAQARAVLTNEFGLNISNVVMFDGGLSTQLVCRGTNYLTTLNNRPIPNVIEVLEF
jgi:hypothetical protein